MIEKLLVLSMNSWTVYKAQDFRCRGLSFYTVIEIFFEQEMITGLRFGSSVLDIDLLAWLYTWWIILNLALFKTRC